MRDQYRLLDVENSQLLAGLSELVRQSSVLTGQILAHLVELEERMLHLELGYSSLFAYCVEALGMSEGAAGRRVAASRVCRRFPEVFDRIARGQLHLCALCALAPHLNPENATELFAACTGKTRRQVEELLAMRFPRPDVREQIRRLPQRGPVAAAPQSKLAAPGGAGPIASSMLPAPSMSPVPSKSPAPSMSSTAQEVPQSSPKRLPPLPEATAARRSARQLEPLSPGRFGVHFTADAELRDLIERARALASHRLPSGDLAGLMKLMASSFVRQEERRRFGVGARPRLAEAVEKEARPARAAERTSLDEVSALAKASRRTSNAPHTRTASSAPASEQSIRPVEVPAPAKTAESTMCQKRARTAKRSRYVTAAVRRNAHGRAGGQCAFVSADGRRCNARAFLEFDHIEPYASFGGPDSPNIRLLCSAHNQLHARNCFGKLHLAAKIAARKRLRPDPVEAR